MAVTVGYRSAEGIMKGKAVKQGGIVVNGNAASVSEPPGPGAVGMPHIEQGS